MTERNPKYNLRCPSDWWMPYTDEWMGAVLDELPDKGSRARVARRTENHCVRRIVILATGKRAVLLDRYIRQHWPKPHRSVDLP